jgi:MFS family permease
MRLRGPEALGALREREFRLLFTGQSISLLGDGMVGVALSFAVLDLTGSVTDLGLVLAARTIPLVVFLLVGGVFADRLPRRAVMLTADLVRFGTQGVIAALLIAGHATIWQLAATQAVYGTATAFFNPASTGLIPTVISPGRLHHANALRGLAMALRQRGRPCSGRRARGGVQPRLGARRRRGELRRQRVLPGAASAARAREAARQALPS